MFRVNLFLAKRTQGFKELPLVVFFQVYELRLHLSRHDHHPSALRLCKFLDRVYLLVALGEVAIRDIASVNYLLYMCLCVWRRGGGGGGTKGERGRCADWWDVSESPPTTN